MARSLLLICLLCLGGCDRDDLDYAVGTIERHRIDLTADSSEPVIALHVREGDKVTPDTLLIQQDQEKVRIRLAQSEAQEALSRARLEEAESGPRTQEITRGRAQLAAARSALSTAEQELSRQKALVTMSYVTESQVDILQGRVDEAQARTEESQARLAELLEGTRTEQVDQARAAYAASKAVVEDLELDLTRTAIKAPVAGVVESIVFRIGERPARGQTMISLLATTPIFARVHIPQPLRTRLSSGAEALIRIDGHEQDYRGRIRWISSEAAFTPFYALTQHDRSRLAYLAEIDLQEDVELPNGVPVEVRFPELTADAP